MSVSSSALQWQLETTYEKYWAFPLVGIQTCKYFSVCSFLLQETGNFYPCKSYSALKSGPLPIIKYANLESVNVASEGEKVSEDIIKDLEMRSSWIRLAPKSSGKCPYMRRRPCKDAQGSPVTCGWEGPIRTTVEWAEADVSVGASSSREVRVRLYLSVIQGGFAPGKLQPQTFFDCTLAQVCHMRKSPVWEGKHPWPGCLRQTPLPSLISCPSLWQRFCL